MTDSPDASPSSSGPPAAPGNLAGTPFEAGLAELNDIVGRLESGALGLSDSIAAYERGVTILRHLHSQLADVEERVRVLVRIDEQGRPVVDEQSGAAGGNGASAGAAADQPGARRGARAAPRPARPKRLPGMDEEARGAEP